MIGYSFISKPENKQLVECEQKTDDELSTMYMHPQANWKHAIGNIYLRDKSWVPTGYISSVIEF